MEAEMTIIVQKKTGAIRLILISSGLDVAAVFGARGA